MPQHKKRAGRGLSIELDDPSAPLYPGSVVRGRVVRKSLICENINIHVRLLGRAKAKFDHPGIKGYSCNTRTRSPFWNRGDVSVSLGSDLAFIQLGNRPLSWEFELKLPLVTQSLTGPEPGRQTGFADPGHPLPASIEWEDIRISKDIEAFVEYWLEAVMESDRTYFRTDATLPLRVLPTPSPVAISNFKMRDHRFSGSFGAAVPFGVLRLVLTDSLATVKHKFGKVPPNPEVYVVGAHFKILTEVHISDPTIQQGELFTWSSRPDESEWVRTRPRVASDGIAVPLEFKQQLVLKEQPVDLGKAMGLRLNDDGSFEGVWFSSLRAASRPSSLQTVSPEITTYCMKTRKSLSWDIRLLIGGKPARFRSSLPFKLVPPAARGTVPAAAAAVANSIPSPANDSEMVDSPPIYEAVPKTERVVTRLPQVTSLDYQLIQPSNLHVADEILRRYTSNHISSLRNNIVSYAALDSIALMPQGAIFPSHRYRIDNIHCTQTNSIMPRHQYKGCGDLKIKLDNPSTAIYPGSIVRGRVICRSLTNTSVTLRVRLMGRVKAKFATDDHGFLGIAKKVRLRHYFWNPHDTVLHDGWLRIELDDRPKSWAFGFQLPHTMTESAVNMSKEAVEAGFTPENYPLPPSYSCKKRLDGKVFEGFVEYWLEAIVEEKTRIVEARLPLWIYPQPSPEVISDFQLRSMRLTVPSDEQVLKNCSGEPYELYFERPSVLQFGAAIPFRIRIVPDSNSDDDSDTDFFKPKPLEIFLVRAEFSIRTSTHIFCPSSDDKPVVTKRSKERSWWHWRDDEAILRGAPGAIVVPTGPDYKPIDVGDALGLKFTPWVRLEGVIPPRPRRSRAVERMVPDFATSFLKIRNVLCWKIQLSIAGKTVWLGNSSPVKLMPPTPPGTVPVAPQPLPQQGVGDADTVPGAANDVEEPAGKLA
ncbi:hypothetical protein CPLU01_13195 [Colletotrichum plurivorum]|uniref:Arrestin-like N-terminal domain-containing protein n=1 Tax=Colletotrichum plurivorum TaxID=2175906 RepID=A0A8H6JTE8_9PEZI|nr:hypothetical protein CPLU01_13195 [Colletotrichum plurivorum]